MFRRTLMILITAAALGACSDDSADRSAAPDSGNGDTPATGAGPTPPYGSSDSEPLVSPGSEAQADARVSIASTQGSQATGQLTITREGDGARIRGQISGLAPNGQYGFHIHETGDCSAPDASSAGEHFNPTGQPHGNPASGAHHVGDLTNIGSDATGSALVDVMAPGVTLGGDTSTSIVGKAVIVHESADDYSSQPAGNTGNRLGCGVIELAS